MFDLQTLLAALPPPRDDEPPSLRSDIVDELLDHLQCAFRREILKDGDEIAAEQRVLSRFGDPKQLARRLWWQAMWSRVMGKRILSGLQWLLTLAAVVLAGAVLWQQSAVLKEIQLSRQEQQATSAALQKYLAAGTTPTDQAATDASHDLEITTTDAKPAEEADPFVDQAKESAEPLIPKTLIDDLGFQLVVKLVEGTESGPVVDDASVSLFTSTNQEIPGQSSRDDAVSGLPVAPLGFRLKADGQFGFLTLERDRYILQVTTYDGQRSRQPVLIRDYKRQEITVVCPSSRKKAPVLITGPALSEKVQSKATRVKYYVEEMPITVGTVEWFPPASFRQIISFDAATQLPVTVDVLNGRERNSAIISSLDLSKSSPEDRAIFLLTGPVQAAFVEAQFSGGSGKVFSTAPDSLLRNTVKPGENVWALTWPRQAEEFLFGPATTEPAPKSPMPDDKAGANAPIPDGKGRIVVKLTAETKDGPTPKDVVVNLLAENGGLSIDHVNSPREGNLPKEDKAKTLMMLGHPPAEDGIVRFDVEPGRYGISVLFRDGRYFTTRLKPVDAGETLTEHVICPPAATKTGVLITAPPVPEDLRRDDLDYEATLVSTPYEFEGRNWRMFTPIEQPLVFDQATGHAIRAGETDLSQDKPEDREVFLPAGKYRIHYSLALIRKEVLVRKETGEIKVENLARRPDEGQFETEPIEYTISPTEKTLDIKINDDFWAEARKKLAELEAKPAPEPVIPARKRPMPDDKAGATAPIPAGKSEAGLSLAVFDEDHQRPMRGVRVTLHRIGEKRLTIPKSFASAATTAQGQVSFSDLDRAEMTAVVTVPETNLRSIYTFDLSQPQADRTIAFDSKAKQPELTWFHGYALSAPSRVDSAELTFRTNLPDDLAAAKVKVCFAVASDAVTVNKQSWQYSTAYERIVVGPAGFEGMLQLPLVARDVNEAFLTGRHQISPAAEREIRVPALTLRASQLTLICPAKSKASEVEEAKPEEWQVCARTPVRKVLLNDDTYHSPGAGSTFRLEPVASESNEWLISVPEEMFADARKKIAELEGKPAQIEPEQKLPEDPETPADAAAKTLRENARRPQGFGYDPKYAWLRGYVDFDRETKQWFIVYSATSAEDSRYAGNLAFGDHKLLGNLKPGDHVVVEGKVDQPKDESAKPRYQIEKLQRLK